MKVQRFDKLLITDSMYKKDSYGFLTITAPIARPGVFPYQSADGTVRMEAKLPDDVFSDLTIQTARAKVVTDNHPNEPVTLENVQRYSKGMTHTDSKIEGGMLVVSMTITDADLMEKIYSGEQSEISIGFFSDIIEQSGAYKGQEYSYIQRDIEINHVAIVPEGRAGSEVAIRFDAAAWQIDEKQETKTEGGKINMVKFKIDSADNAPEYEIDEAVKKHIESLQGRADAAENEVQTKKQEIATLKQNVLTEDTIEEAVKSRIKLIEDAKPLLEDNFDFAGKKEREIKEAVILKAKPDFKADGKSDEYIDAFFEARIALVNDSVSATGEQSLITGDSKEETLDAVKNKRLNMNK